MRLRTNIRHYTRNLMGGVCSMLAILILAMVFVGCVGTPPEPTTALRLALPTTAVDTAATAGFFKGVSGAHVARLGEYLIVAGGSNFPHQAAADGGPKVYYSDIYAAKLGGDSLEWHLIGHLPKPLAYGMTAVYGDKLYIAGGRAMQVDTFGVGNNDAMESMPYTARSVQHSLSIVGNNVMNTTSKPWVDTTDFSKGWFDYREYATDAVLSLTYDGHSLAIDTSYMPLPAPRSGAAAVVADNLWVLVGGIEEGSSTNSTIYLDFTKPHADWRYGSDYPGAPLLKVTATTQRTDDTTYLYMVGSFAGHDHPENLATLSLSAFRYNVLTHTWSSFAAPVEAAAQGMTFGGGMAWPVGEDYVAFTGGVNHQIFLNAINRDKTFAKHRLTWENFERYYATLSVPDRPEYPTAIIDSLMQGITYPGDDATPEEMARYQAAQAQADKLWKAYDAKYLQWRKQYGRAWDKEQDDNYNRFAQMQQAQEDSMARVKYHYLRHKPEWYGFCDIIWLYNVRTAQWYPTAHNADVARADAGVVLLPRNGVLLVGGETMPGVRTPQITQLTW
ncbi:MAG: hypothetical protein Q4A44_00450 [Bacteroidales bacterium]|nr:hypothetical protein [Bacteroidales bacterium]